MNYGIYQYISNTWQQVLSIDLDGVSTSGTPINFGTINLGGESQVIQLAVKANPGYQITSATMPIVPSGTASSCLAVSADNIIWNTYGTNVDVPITNPTDYNIFYIKRNTTGENAGNGLTDVGIGINIPPTDCTIIPTLSTPAITANSPSAGNIFIQVTTAAVSNAGATILYDFHDDVGDLLLGNISEANATTGQTISVPGGTYNVYAVAKDTANSLTQQSNTVTGIVVAQPVNNAPVISSVIISGSASVGSTLTANVTGSDPDTGDTVTYSFQWLRNGVAITGAISQTYILVSADGGNTVTVTATPTDNHGLSGTAVTSAGVSVSTVNNPPTVSNLDWSDAVCGTGGKVILYGSATDTEAETITQLDFILDQNSTYDANTGVNISTNHFTKSITSTADIQAFQTSGYTWTTPGWPNAGGQTFYLWMRASDASGTGQWVKCGTAVIVSQSVQTTVPTLTSASMDASGNITVSITDNSTATYALDVLVDNVIKVSGLTGSVSNYSLNTSYSDKNPHYVRVEARNTNTGSTWTSTTVTVTPPDIAPTALASNQISIGSVTSVGCTITASGTQPTDSDDPTATLTFSVFLDGNSTAYGEYTWTQLIAGVNITGQTWAVGSHTVGIQTKAVTGAKTETSATTTVTGYVSGIKSISATGGVGQNTITFTGSGISGVTFNIYRGIVSGGETLLGAGVTSPFVDTGLIIGTTYYYKVSEVINTVESPLSIEVSATPTTASQLTGLVPIAGNAQVSLSWNAGSAGATYTVYRSTANGTQGSAIATGLTTNSYVDTGLTNGTTYYYEVTQTVSGAESTPSAQISTIPQATISVSDTFTSTNGTALSSNWTKYSNKATAGSQATIQSNKASFSVASSDGSFASLGYEYAQSFDLSGGKLKFSAELTKFANNAAGTQKWCALNISSNHFSSTADGLSQNNVVQVIALDANSTPPGGLVTVRAKNSSGAYTQNGSNGAAIIVGESSITTAGVASSDLILDNSGVTTVVQLIYNGVNKGTFDLGFKLPNIVYVSIENGTKLTAAQTMTIDTFAVANA